MVTATGKPAQDDVLSPDEWAVLEAMAQGVDLPNIARQLRCPVGTVRRYQRGIFLKWVGLRQMCQRTVRRCAG
jgi:DNA-binding NarL/FixJ family response regulator